MRLQYDIQVYSFFLEVLMNKDMPVISYHITIACNYGHEQEEKKINEDPLS